MASNNPDIRILIGVANGTTADGDSGKLIRDDLKKIVGQINQSPMKIKLKLDIEDLKKQAQAIGQSSLTLNFGGKSSARQSSGSFVQQAREIIANSAAVDVNTEAKNKNAAADQKSAKITSQAQSQLSALNSYLKTVKPTALKDLSVQITDVRNKMELAVQSGKKMDFDQANIGFKNLKSSMKDLGAEGGNVFTYLEGKIKTFAVYLMSSAITMGVVTSFNDAIKTVKDLDQALTNLRIVTNGTRESARELLTTYNQMAQELGATTRAVADSAVEWQRQGYNLQDTNTLIKDSMVLSIVGFMDETEAAEALTAAMKGYGLAAGDAIGVVDKFTGVDLKAATSSGDLAVALSKTAANAKLAGLSLDDVIGQLAVVNETMKESGETTGTFYNTMLSRMGSLKSGRLDDPETGESLSDVETVLNRLGIKLRDSGNEFRNFGDVLDEVVRKWKEYDSVTQRSIAQAFAGTRQQTRFLSLMAGYEQATKYAETASNSAGTAMQKFGTYQESLEAKANRLTAAFENMATSLIPSGLIGGLYDAGAAALNFGAELGGLPITVVAVTTSLFAVVSALRALKDSTLGISIATTFSDVVGFIPSLAAEGVLIQSVAAAKAGEKVSTDALSSSISRLSAAKISSIAVSANLSKHEMFEILRSSQLSMKKKQEVWAHYKSATAKTVDSAATNMLTVSMSGLLTTIKTFLLTNPFGWAIIAAGVIATLASAIDASVITLKEQQQITEKLNKTFQDTVNELEGINTELESTRKKISELKSQGPLSFTEQNDLTRLEIQNAHLEQQVKILERKKALEAEKVNESVGAEYTKGFQSANGDYRSIYDFEEKRHGSQSAGMVGVSITKEQSYAEQIQHLRQLRASQQNLMTEDISVMSDAEFAAHQKQLKQIDAQIGVTEGKITDIASDYNALAGKFAPINDEDFAQVEAWTAKAQEGLNAINGITWTTEQQAKFNEIWNEPQFNEVKNSLLGLASAGELTADTLQAEKYKPFLDELERIGVLSADDGITIEGLANHIQSLGISSEDTASQVGTLKDALEKISSTQDLLQSMKKELADNKNISLDTLQKIIEKYGDLEGAVAQYSAGVLSSSQLMYLVRQKYDKDIAAYGKLIVAKSEMNNSFFSNMLRQNKLWVSEFAKKYGVDLTNYKNLAEAKLAIEKQLLGTITGAWERFYDAQTNSLTGAAYAAGMGAAYTRDENGNKVWTGPKTPEQKATQETLNSVQRMTAAKNELKDVALDIATSNLDFSIPVASGSKEIEAYIVEIDKLREAFQRLEDVKNAINTTEAKFDLVDEDDLARQEQFTNQLIGLYKNEQAELHNLNNARDGLISGITDELRGKGFDVGYNADVNDFWVKNPENLRNIKGKDQEETNKLIKYYEDLIKLAENYNKENIDGSLEYWKIQKQIQDLENDLQQKRIDALEKQRDSLNELVDLVKDMIKQEKEDEIDALESQKDAYREILELKKKSLELTERERSYQENVDGLNSEIQKLQAKADLLALDDSRAAQIERGKLLEEIAEKQKDLSDTQHDYSLENQKDALDKEYDDFEKQTDDKIKVIKDFLANNEALTKAAYDRIDRDGNQCFSDLTLYCTKYTNTSMAELTNMWAAAQRAAEKYGSVAQAALSIGAELDRNENGSSSDADIRSVAAEMKKNSEAWHKASASERKRLEALNASLGKSIGATIDQNGVWWINGKKLYEYHTGGVVGGTAQKGKEVFAKVLDGEVIFNEAQQGKLLKMLNVAPQFAIGNMLSAASRLFPVQSRGPSTSTQVAPVFNIYPTDYDDFVNQFKKHGRELGNILIKQFT